MVRSFRTTFYFYPARARATDPSMGRGRRLSLPLFLPYKRSAVCNERMERLARSQFAKMDWRHWRFHRHLSQSGPQWRLADLYIHGRPPHLSLRTPAQIHTIWPGPFWRRVRSPHVSFERRISQDHNHERRLRLGRRWWSAIEDQPQMGAASV